MKKRLSPKQQQGSITSLVAAIFAVALVVGTVILFVTADSDSPSSAKTESTPPAKPEVFATEKQAPHTETPTEIEVDPNVFCDQIAQVGNIFGEELTGATVRTNVSNGPQVGCSWSGPYVMVYFGDDSYNRRNTGFGSENLVAYEGTDQEAVKREKYAVHSGFEVEVKSDSGLAFRISQSTGRQTDLTPDEYKRIANIVNKVLNEHY